MWHWTDLFVWNSSLLLMCYKDLSSLGIKEVPKIMQTFSNQSKYHYVYVYPHTGHDSMPATDLCTRVMNERGCCGTPLELFIFQHHSHYMVGTMRRCQHLMSSAAAAELSVTMTLKVFWPIPESKRTLTVVLSNHYKHTSYLWLK